MFDRAEYTRWKSVYCHAVIAACLAFSHPLLAQDNSVAEEDTADLGKLKVTGSRIQRLDVEGPSPVTIITREEIERRGFATVYEALENLTQNTGTLQGEQYANSFTPNAQSLSLRSFGGGATLVLLNGKRAADYPQPYNSESNFFNFAQIPAAAIDRVEILASGASAIYGSDAIAGVINIILRDDVTAPTLTARAGTTFDGGGESQLVSLVWGKQWDKASLMFTAEWQNMEAIHGKDRDYLDDVTDAPQIAGNVPLTRSALVLSNWYGAPTPAGWAGPGPYPGVYYDPGEAACDNLQSAGVPYIYALRSTSGYYCGRDDFGDETLQNPRERSSAYVNFNYDLTDSTSLYSHVMYWDSKAESEVFHLWWGADVWDPDIVSDAGFAGDWVYLQRVFHPNETGNQGSVFDESSVNAVIGLEGSFSNFWNWDVGFSYSANDTYISQPRFKEEVANSYFGGTGMTDICVELGLGCSFFQPDRSTAQFNIYDPLSQADIAAVMGLSEINSDASVWSFQAQLDGDLVDMPAGPLQFAAVVEYASQQYDITPDNRLLDQTGNGWWGLSGTGGGGERNRVAAGIEFSIPIVDKLTAVAAARYDYYDDDSQTDGAPTWALGLEYRPIDSILLRGNYNTSFRAPDMHYLFADESGFFSSTRDIYQCRAEAAANGVAYNELACDPNSQLAGVRQGELGLKEEDGNSFNLGIVISPNNDLKFSIDYYDIELKNVVNDMSIQQLARDEADCQLGVTTNGEPVDVNSAECANVLSRVTREPTINPAEIPDYDTFYIGPINTSLRHQTGFDAALSYGVETQATGTFNLEMSYTHVLKDELQVYDFDPIEDDYRDNLQNFNARSVVNGSLNWSIENFDTTLYAFRLGSMPNWQETGRLPTWTIYNATATMMFLDDKLAVTGIINNIWDTRPPYDDGFNTWPFFFRGQYNARGREMFLQLRYTFE